MRAKLFILGLCVVCLFLTTFRVAGQTVDKLRVVVTDAQGLAVAGARCVLTQNDKQIAAIESNAEGAAEFLSVTAGEYNLKIEKDGFQTLVKNKIQIGTAAHATREIAVTLEVAALAAEVTISNQSDNANTIESGSAPPTGTVQRQTLERLPLATKRVDQAIPLVPGVIRSSNGQISINGATEDRSAFRVNNLNVADPASGNFRLNLPIDAVESVQVFQHPYLAEFGQFTGGLTNVETRRGGEKLHFEFNDFLPDFRFHNGKFYGVQDNSPRINVNGPLIKDKFYFSQSLGYAISKQPVRGLTFPNNETVSESQSYFTQLDYILSPKHSATFTFGYFPERQQYINLDFFRQRPVTPNYKQRDFVTTLRDNYALGGGLLQFSISLKKFDASVWGQGTQEQTFTPTGEFGNYFSNQSRRSFRTEILEVYEFPAREIFFGVHTFKIGFDFAHVGNKTDYAARPVNVRRANGTLAERIVFDARTALIEANNRTYTFFVQDRWMLRPNFSIDGGVRTEDQRIASERNFAPRGGFAWSPFKNDKTIVRGGFGYFYDKVPLNIRAFKQYPARTVTRYAADGVTVLNRQRFENILIATRDAFPLDFRRIGTQIGFVPENFTWNVQVDQIVNKYLSLRANFTKSRTDKIYVVTPEVDYRNRRAIVLSPTGQAVYTAFELMAKIILPENQPLYVSYVRSKAKGDLNDFNSYFGDFGYPLVRANQFSNLPTDTPNRLLAWGAFRLPYKFTFAPILEIRDGFPYSVVNQAQFFVGTRNADNQRFPMFVSLDAEISKDIQITKKYAVRLSLRGFNLTDHFNPRNVRNNTGDREFGSFINSYRRYFTAGFDILF
jgi:hypothetical protein